MSRSRLPSQVAAWSDGAVGTLRLKDEGEVTGPVDNTGRERKIQPEHASRAREGVAGEWRQDLSRAYGGADARGTRVGIEPAAVLVGVVIDERQRAHNVGSGGVGLKTDAYDRDVLGQDLVIDQDAVWADARGDHVPGRPIRVSTVDSRTADVSERDNSVGGSRRFGGWRDGVLVVRRKR